VRDAEYPKNANPGGYNDVITGKYQLGSDGFGRASQPIVKLIIKLDQ
jgi:hypothetical protein